VVDNFSYLLAINP